MTNTRESQFNLVDFNEYIIREICKNLDHLSNKNLRNVCKYLRKCVDGYIKGGDSFMLVSEELPSKIMYAVKGYNNLVSFGLEPIEELPHPFKDITRETLEDRSQFYSKYSEYFELYSKLDGKFCALMNNRIVIGTFYEVSFRECVDSCIKKDKSRNKKRTSRSYKYGTMIIPYLYEYDVVGKKWLPILPLDTDPPFIMKTDGRVANIYTSVTSDSIMVGVFVESMSLCLDCIVDNRTFDYKLVKFQFHIANNGFYSKLTTPNDRSVNNQIYGKLVSSMTYFFTSLDTPKYHFYGCCKNQGPTKCQGTNGLFLLEIEPAEDLIKNVNKESNLGFYCPINIDENKIILIARSFDLIPYQILWQETLQKYEVDMKWRKIPQQFLEQKVLGCDTSQGAWKKMFYVRLKDNVYIIKGCLDKPSMISIKEGTYNLVGLRCDRYSITEEKYYPCVSAFPDSFCCIDRVVTDKEETFAILLGIKADTTNCTSLKKKIEFKTSWVVLTEQKGLTLLPTKADNALSQVLSEEQEVRLNNVCSYINRPNKTLMVTDYLLLGIK
jgi:hypothetical protein